MPAAIAGVLGTAAATAGGLGATGAALAGAAASAAGGLISGALQSGSVDSGAAKATGISQAAIDKATTNYQPYMTAGTNALGAYSDAAGLNGAAGSANALASFTASPGYAYDVSQGLKAVDSGAARSGMLQSGATVKAEQTLGNNLADQDFGNYVNRLGTLTNTGLTATNSLSNVLNGQATNQEGIATGAASQDASIYGNTASGLTSAAKGVNWNSLFNSGSTATSGYGTGANGGNSAGANSLQGLGLYNPISTGY